MTPTGIRRYPSIRSNKGVVRCPLTFQQERVLFFCELNPGTSIWDINTCKRLTGEVRVRAMMQAVERLIEGHPILRTRISRGNDGPIQSFDQSTDDAFRHIDLSRRSRHDVEEALASRISEICRQPISGHAFEDLLFEVVLLTLGRRDHALLLRVHHIISDAASVALLWRDLTFLYNRLVCGEPASLPPRTLQYSDYAIWQRRHFGEEQTREQEEYWLSEFCETVPALDLPTDSLPSPTLSFAGGLEIVPLPKKLIDEFQKLCWQKRVLLYSSLLAVYFVLLQKLCQQDDITVGVLFSGRHYCPELNDIAGFFVNTTAVRGNVGRGCTFGQLVKKVHEKVEAAYHMQDYPFERLIQKLAPDRGDGRVPLIRTMFNLVSNVEDEGLLEGLEQARWIDVARHTNAVQVDLIFDVHWGARGAEIRIEHNTDVFRTATVVRLARHYIMLLRQLCSSWDVDLRALELVDEDEKRRLVESWNPGRTPYARDKCVHELFEEQVRERPDQIAIVDGDVALTYGEANRRSNRLARALGDRGVGPDSIVAIVGGRSAEMVIGQLGILKAGGAYLPIAEDRPRQRIIDIVRDAGAQALIVPDGSRGAVNFPGPVLRLGRLDASDRDEWNLACRTGPCNLAYVMHTSGSTGCPKGVMVEHRSVVNLVKNANYIELRPGDQVLQTGAPDFDAATFEVWATLLNGLTLHVAADSVLLDAKALSDFLVRNRVTIMFLVPHLFQHLAEADATLFGALAHLIVGGDVLSASHVERVREVNPSLNVVNAYGPTENTTYSTVHRVSRTEQRTIPIGKPVPNSKADVLDRDMNLSPIGAIGELHVGGDGLARGYLNRPALTAEKFIPNPAVPGERVYKTGDLVRRRGDGSIEFVGRVDRQTKIRGFRIELGEIENRLLEHAGIVEAVVTSAASENGDRYLCAYYVSDSHVSIPDLRRHLAEKLPGYTVPSCLCRVDRMPLTRSGKIDQRSLSEPGPFVEAEDRQTLMRSDAAISIARIWEELLQTSNIGPHENFFQIGGHSLMAGSLASRLSEEFGVEVSLRTVFDSPTVDELAIVVDKDREKERCGGIDD